MDAVNPIVESLSAEEKREALNLVFRSQTFARSDRLKNLLRFVCETEIEGRIHDLNEYVIGVEALGRPQGYSPGEDSSVRSRADELRNQREKFYSTEAPGAPFRIEIPKGSYVPHYVRARVAATRPQPVRETNLRFAIVFFLGVALTSAVFATWNRGFSRDAAWTPDLEAVWKPMIDSKAPILVSFQTRLFLRVGPLNVRDWKVNTISGVEGSDSLMRMKQYFNAPQLYENYNYVDFGAANAVFQLSKLLATRKQNIFAKRSTDVTWEDLKTNNVVIMGKPEADPTISRWLAKGKFSEEGGRIRNLQPAPGEPAEWVDDSDAADSS